MAQPTSTPIDPSNPIQPQAGKPQRQDTLDSILHDIQTQPRQNRSRALAGGILLVSPNGTVAGSA